ncbi:MAG: single-stranded-DNA-specific exonuclease C-terminal domain-containing protein [Culicoidibacterales bacterium]
MLAAKFNWQNANDEPTTKINRNILLKPNIELIEQTQFSEEKLLAIEQTILTHIEKGNKICICGDYDVDGMTGTAILVKTLTKIQADVSYVIPDRFIDGYGISLNILQQLNEKVKLIITVDNGIAAVNVVQEAIDNKIDVIITDHHETGDTLPCATHILHPKLDDVINTTEICGAAVAFILAKFLLRKQKDKQLADEFLQLCTLATLADMMPLDIPFNRAITYNGYQKMRKTPILLISAFLTHLKIDTLKSDELSFQIIPRLNAVGRLADANLVVETMLMDNSELIKEKIIVFDEINAQRKMMTQTIQAEILEDARNDRGRGFYFACGNNWHQGVLGIVAQKIMQEISRPVILVTTNQNNQDELVGSARAFGPYSVKHCLDDLKKTLIKSGGHSYAGGLSIECGKLEAAKSSLDAYNARIIKKIPVNKLKLPLLVDAWMQMSDLNQTFLTKQEQFEPYGENNKSFHIGVKDVKIIDMQILGKDQKHLKLTIEQEKKKYVIICFFQAELLDKIAIYATINLIIQCQKNHFNGIEKLQYLLVDIESTHKQIFDYRNIKYHKTPLELSNEGYKITEIPIDINAFNQQLQAPEIAKLYLVPIKNEQEFIYAATIEKHVFSYVYKFMHKHKSINLTDVQLYLELYQKKIPKSIFLYIINVFFELNFVIIKGDTCNFLENQKKLSLEQSVYYQNLGSWLKIRNMILFDPVDIFYKYILDYQEKIE